MTPPQGSQVRTGIVMIVIGLMLLVGQLNLWPAQFGRLWPVVLIALGAFLLLFPSDGRHRRGAWWLVFVGGLFVLHTYRVASLRDTWPLFVVAAGISVMVGGRDRAPARREP